jgi:phosphinothricin acetyltransferase
MVECGRCRPGYFLKIRPASALHQSLGFREIGRRERIGMMSNTWRDVVLLERRSAKAGV